MKANGLAMEWTLERRGRRARGGAAGDTEPTPSAGRLPRITRLMALAIKFQDMVDRGEVRDYADLARLGYVTRARLTQIMNLSLLAPDIQEAILLMLPTAKGRDGISERSLRKVTAIPSWTRQRAEWRDLPAKRWLHHSS